MSTVFYTSDPHIGHRLVAIERAERAGVPVIFGWDPAAEDYADKCRQWHDAELARIWDAVVGKDDVVHVVGDISSGTNPAVRAALQWFSERPGRKVLTTGNHDPVHAASRNSAKWVRDFQEVFDPAIFPWRRVKVNGSDVMVSHYPYEGDHTDFDRDVDYRVRDNGRVIIHGHTHSTEQVSRTSRGTLQIHVGVDAWGLAPVRLAQVSYVIDREQARA